MIIALSTVPGEPQPGDSAFVWAVAATPTVLQKVMHVVAYALLFLSWSLVTAERETGIARISSILLAVVAFGAILEYLQLAVPGRFGSLVDVGLNTIGALGGVVIFVAIKPATNRDTLSP